MTNTLTEALRNSGKSSFKRQEIITVGRNLGMEDSSIYKTINKLNRVTRGFYSLSEVSKPQVNKEPQQIESTQIKNRIANRGVSSVSSDEVFIPKTDPSYIKWGSYTTIMDIIKSRMFFPTYIAGMSGNGKTMMVEQACAQAKREYVRIQISPETDEDDLIGGFRLIDGETVFQKGPVIKAMEAGAILLIDEIDRATNKIMCLQGVLEGSPVLLKKTGEVITPAEGFNVIATANTKGRGSDDGRFTAASIIDEAFLERFVGVVDQPFPQPTVEKKIIMSHMTKYGAEDFEFANKLIAWSNVIRKTFESDGIEEVISTRRLCHIVKSFTIFKDRMKSINMCISRFDDDVRQAFLDLYTKIDESQLTEDGQIVQHSETPQPVNQVVEEVHPF
jgi:hypothetical protein